MILGLNQSMFIELVWIELTVKSAHHFCTKVNPKLALPDLRSRFVFNSLQKQKQKQNIIPSSKTKDIYGLPKKKIFFLHMRIGSEFSTKYISNTESVYHWVEIRRIQTFCKHWKANVWRQMYVYLVMPSARFCSRFKIQR